MYDSSVHDSPVHDSSAAGHTDGPRPTLYTSVMFSLAGRTIDGKVGTYMTRP